MDLVANLDTSRLTQLVEDPGRPGVSEWVRRLQNGSVHLVIGVSRAAELARLPRPRREEVVRFLRDVPTLLGQPETVLEEDELASACALVSGLVRRAPKAFARETADWGVHINAPGGSAADLVASVHWDQGPDEFRRVADELVLPARALRETAAVVEDRAVVVRNALARHLHDFRSRNAAYAGGLQPDEVLERAGGLAGFPAFYVPVQLAATRLAEGGGEANDLLDEDIARYHPYSAVSVYDTRTWQRFWRAGLLWRERATNSLEAGLHILDKVESGEISVSPFFLPSLVDGTKT